MKSPTYYYKNTKKYTIKSPTYYYKKHKEIHNEKSHLLWQETKVCKKNHLTSQYIITKQNETVPPRVLARISKMPVQNSDFKIFAV